MKHRAVYCTLLCSAIMWGQMEAMSESSSFTVTGQIIDGDTGETIAARVYLQDQQGEWHFVESAHPSGQTVIYDRQNWINQEAIERYTNVSAHPFQVSLSPGNYTMIVERGKEYRPAQHDFSIENEDVQVEITVHRWIDMAEKGWYSGDTHVHRTVEELHTILPAEDLHAAFPLTYWVTVSDTPPSQGEGNLPDPGYAPILVENNRVIFPRNTEYEIFRVGDVNQVLGAFFVLNHKNILEHTAPPVTAIGEQAREEGALIDMDKADWAWSMMLPPVLGVDLFELANNHVWRTAFGFNSWNAPAPAYMNLPNEGKSGTELDWILYGFHCYYALLNSGFRLRPTAGTANGVHPVPLGFGRVYVHIGDNFIPEAWYQGLDAGRSFVTTGPMALFTLDDQIPGHTFKSNGTPISGTVSGTIISENPLSNIEVIINGHVALVVSPENTQNERSAYVNSLKHNIVFEKSSWVAIRCFEPHPGDKVRFAHTAPWHIDIEGKPLYPTPEQIAFLIDRCETPRHQLQDILSEEALAEFDKAAAIYHAIAKQAEAHRVQENQLSAP